MRGNAMHFEKHSIKTTDGAPPSTPIPRDTHVNFRNTRPFVLRWNSRGVFIAFLLLMAGRGLAATPATASFGSGYYTCTQVAETNGTVALQVVRTGDTNLDFTIDFATSNGTAMAGSDYAAQTGTLHFVPGQVLQNITITILDDYELEAGSEEFKVLLSNPANGAVLGTSNPGCVNIIDNELWSFFDGSFDPGLGPDGTVFALALQPDGKIMAGGEFTSFLYQEPTYSIDRARIARLHPNGSLDAGFDPGLGPNDSVYTVAVQTNGQILIGGAFTNVAGSARSYLARLNANGSLDTNFAPVLNNELRGLAVQPDGRIVIAGRFTSVNAQGRNFIARLNADGSLDASFDPGSGPNNRVRALALQDEGKVLIGGEFTSVNGTSRRRIARLKEDGSLDLTFNPGTGASAIVRAVAAQPDGKVMIGGEFLSVNGTNRARIARLDEDGGLDLTFDPGAGPDNVVRTIALQLDGDVFIGGQFSSVTGQWGGRLARLHANGSVDAKFRPYDVGINGFSDEVFSIVVQPDGFVLVGGQFVGTNGLGHHRVERIFSDPSAPSFALASSFIFGSERDGSVALTVRRLGEASGTASVDFVTHDGSALAGSDYVGTNGTLTFGPHEITKSISLSLINDYEVESDESFEVEIVSPSPGAGLGLLRQATIWLADNDVGVNFGNIVFSTSFVTNESAGTALISVTRGGDSAQTATVDFYTVDGTALAGLDYAPANGTLNFGPGESNKTFAITILQDNIVEGTEMLWLHLTNATGIGLGHNRSTGLYIMDASGTFSFSPSSVSVVENVTTAVASLTVFRSFSALGTISVDYATEDGSALAGVDYAATAGTLTLTNGEFSKTINVPIINDDAVETNKSFIVRLSNPSIGAGIENGAGIATIHILDDDDLVQFTTSTNSISEGGGSALVAVQRTSGSASRTVNFSVAGGTATVGQDFLPPGTNTLLFRPGELTKDIRIQIIDDNLSEFDETLRLTLLSGGYAGARTNTTLVILDNDRGSNFTVKIDLMPVPTNGPAHLGFNTLQHGQYEILYSTNLIHWQSIGTNIGTIIGTGGRVEFIHTNAPPQSHGFYRVHQVQP